MATVRALAAVSGVDPSPGDVPPRKEIRLTPLFPIGPLTPSGPYPDQRPLRDPRDGVFGSWSMTSAKRFTVEARAESDDPVGPNAVMAASGLKIGDTYRWPPFGTAIETDSKVYLQSMDCRPDGEDSTRYRLSVQFGLTAPSQSGFDPEEGYDPFAVPPTFRAYGEDEKFFPLCDINGSPFMNSAGDFMTGISIATSVLVFEIGVVVPAFDWPLIKSVKNHINSVDWMGVPAETVLLADGNPQRIWDERAGIYNWEVTYVFKIKDPVFAAVGGGGFRLLPGWNAEVLDSGLREKVGGKLVPIMDAGVPTTEPFPLKPDGTRLGPTDKPHHLFFDVYPRADFSALNLPASLFGA